MGTKGRAATVACAGLAAAATIAMSSGAARAAEGGATVIRGTDLPADAGLAHVGCVSPYSASATPLRPWVARGDAPLGERSLGFTTPAGDAAGPVRYTGSLAAVDVASIAVDAPAGTTGVVYVGYQDPLESGTDSVWFGRAEVTVPAGGWTRVDATSLTYSWDRYDARTGAVTASDPTSTLASFVARRGDGAGLVATTFGCDGASFTVDALRFGTAGAATTYDFEGLATTLRMSGAGSTVVAGESVRLRADLAATGGVTIPHATAILERRTADGWATVRVADATTGLAATVLPSESTSYRWRFVDRPLAEGATSRTFVVDVARAVTARVGKDAVTGRVAPGRAGLSVLLRRVDAPGTVVAATTTDADGDYTLPTGDLAGGRYVVTVPAAGGNVTGQSDPVSIDGPAPDPEPTQDPTPDPTPAPTDDPTRTPSPDAPTSTTPPAPPAPPAPPTPSESATSTPPSSAPPAPSAPTPSSSSSASEPTPSASASAGS